MLTVPGKLVLHMGMMGSGKTAAAEGLEKNLGVVRLCREAEMRKLYGSNIDFEDKEQKETAFREILLQARSYLSEGRTVVLDGALFNRRVQVEDSVKLAKSTGSSILPIYFDCDREIAIARIENQKHAVPGRGRERYYRIEDTFESIEIPHHTLDGSQERTLILRDCIALVQDSANAYRVHSKQLFRC